MIPGQNRSWAGGSAGGESARLPPMYPCSPKLVCNMNTNLLVSVHE